MHLRNWESHRSVLLELDGFESCDSGCDSKRAGGDCKPIVGSHQVLFRAVTVARCAS